MNRGRMPSISSMLCETPYLRRVQVLVVVAELLHLGQPRGIGASEDAEVGETVEGLAGSANLVNAEPSRFGQSEVGQVADEVEQDRPVAFGERRRVESIR